MTRAKASAEEIEQQVEKMRKRAEASSSGAEKAFCAEQIGQMQAYLEEIKDYTLELPDITFDDSYELADPAFDLHLQFYGHAHTAGDVFVYCPQRKALATGDASHGWVPNLGDGYPHAWPATIDKVMKGDFKYVLGGHGPMQSDRVVMTNQRNYIEELTEKVEAGKKDGPHRGRDAEALHGRLAAVAAVEWLRGISDADPGGRPSPFFECGRLSIAE